MEQLNKVELIGTVGSVSIQNIGERPLVRFSMATNLMYTNADGEAVCETMWHNVRFFPEGEDAGALKITKGASIEVKGRLRHCRFTDSSGDEKTCTEVVANSVRVLETGGLNPQTAE